MPQQVVHMKQKQISNCHVSITVYPEKSKPLNVLQLQPQTCIIIKVGWLAVI